MHYVLDTHGRGTCGYAVSTHASCAVPLQLPRPSFSGTVALSLWMACVLPVVAYTLPTRNHTIDLLERAANGDNQKLFCSQSQWNDIASFFLVNYVAHAATVQSLPGEFRKDYALNVVFALFFPIAGFARGLNAIFRCAILGKNDLYKALKAGALCTIERRFVTS